MTMTRGELALLSRTAAQLRPVQAVHRARLRTVQAALRRWPGTGQRLLTGPPPERAVGWPAAFCPVDGLLAGIQAGQLPGNVPAAEQLEGRCLGLAELQAGKVRLLGVTRDLGDPPDWAQAEAPRLWRFHLHYWDWAWGLAAEPDRLAARALFARMWRSWQAACRFGTGDAWHPYPAALRAWSWCGLHGRLVAGSDAEPEFLTRLAGHAGFLRRQLEYDVAGNHLVKELKALAGLAIFFADDQLLRLALRRLRRQLRVQVLPDGGHYERAPAYHCQVLGDLIDLNSLLQAAGRAVPAELPEAIGRMRRWLGAVLTPDGRVPLLNDGYPVEAGLLGLLRPGPPPSQPLLVLPDTGLVRAVAGEWDLLADVGAPCPRELPAHAHADTFGCLLHVAGLPLLTDTGTSTYEPGPVRDYERSTAAHSTVEVDGVNSTEVWGAFRAGRRARVSGLAASATTDTIVCEAVHDGYRALPGRPRHQRRWWLTSAGLQVDDLVTGSGPHQVVIRWQLTPGAAVRVDGAAAWISTPAGEFTVTVLGRGRRVLSTETRPVAAGFGETADAPALVCRLNAMLPVRATTVWSRTGGPTPRAWAASRPASGVAAVGQPMGEVKQPGSLAEAGVQR